MDRFVRALEKVQLIAGVIFLSIFFLVIIFQIITRHMGISVIWTEEVANYSFIWAVFMGAAVMVKRREHFNFDFILRKFKHKKKASIQLISDLVLIIFNLFIFLLGLQVVSEFWNYTWAAIPEMKMGYVWISIPIMAGSMIIYSISHLMEHIKLLSAKEVNE